MKPIQTVLTIFPIAIFASSGLYFLSLFWENIEWLAVLTVSDFLDRGVSFFPGVLLFIFIGLIISLENRPLRKKGEAADQHKKRTGWGTPFGRFTDRFLGLLPWISLAYVPFADPFTRMFFFGFFVFGNTYEILFWIAGNAGFKREELPDDKALLLTIGILGSTLIGFASWGFADVQKMSMRQFQAGEISCEGELCSNGELFLERIDAGIITFADGAIRLRSVPEGELLLSAPVESLADRPFICAVLGRACDWMERRTTPERQSEPAEVPPSTFN
ncbi:MAG: hypothetical protein GC208_02355 [Alphaproteobacteria bacterium]|nr:hypothetical protein [Alphaproteobacteria bacterium]